MDIFKKFSGGKNPDPQPVGAPLPDLREGEEKEGEKGRIEEGDGKN
jgi:hypothetical protein